LGLEAPSAVHGRPVYEYTLLVEGIALRPLFGIRHIQHNIDVAGFSHLEELFPGTLFEIKQPSVFFRYISYQFSMKAGNPSLLIGKNFRRILIHPDTYHRLLLTVDRHGYKNQQPRREQGGMLDM